MARSALIASAMLITALVAGGCKKKPPPPPPPPPPQAVEVKLQVTSLSPSTIAPEAETPAKVYGSAFDEGGARVEFTGPKMAIGKEVTVDSGNTLSLTIPALPPGTYDVTVKNSSGESSTLRGGLTVKSAELTCRSVTVNFELDRSTIRPDARSILDGHMSCFQSLTGQVRVEGHCDERGSVDYNVALGQRRAESVKSYLVSNGVSASRVNTVSYGEERPVDRGHNEMAWAKNRRAEVSATE